MNEIEKAAEMVRDSSNIVAFTGAGVSTESNIPDFRSNDGLFNQLKSKYKYPPEVMLSRSFFDSNPKLFFDFYRNKMIFKDAAPNDSHLVLAELEEMGKLKAVITQNVDGLHQAAGSKTVLELHGGIRRNFCMKCSKEFPLEYVTGAEGVPRCDVCNGIVKPDVVLYEEPLDQRVIQKSIEYIAHADVLIVMGTSLVVYPAAGFINYYKGNKLILINMSETPYDRRANLILREKSGVAMRRIMNELKGFSQD